MTSLQRIPCSVIAEKLSRCGKDHASPQLASGVRKANSFPLSSMNSAMTASMKILRKYGVENCTDEDIVELVNDCICCTVSDDFVSSLNKIPVLKPCVDHILIETSGLALPRPLVQLQWPGVKISVLSMVSSQRSMALHWWPAK